MNDSNQSPICCGTPASWIENVPGKGYMFCRECKKEVAAEPSAQELQALEGPRPVMGVAGEQIFKGDMVVFDRRGLLPPRTGLTITPFKAGDVIQTNKEGTGFEIKMLQDSVNHHLNKDYMDMLKQMYGMSDQAKFYKDRLFVSGQDHALDSIKYSVPVMSDSERIQMEEETPAADLHRRNKIFFMDRHDWTVDEMIQALRGLPKDATLRAVSQSWERDTIEFKFNHQSFKPHQPGTEFERVSLELAADEEDDKDYDWDEDYDE